MPDNNTTRPDNRPMEGFQTAFLPTRPDCPVRLFLPSDYQPKYAYPLVVLLHEEGGDEDAAIRLAPLVSRRNYIAACPRGPIAHRRSASGRPGFAWSDDVRARDCLRETLAYAQVKYHIHAERIYLMGIGQSAMEACRLGLALADQIAGVVALNGQIPSLNGRGSRALSHMSCPRIFIGHGANNPVNPIAAARQSARQMDRAGAEVLFHSYPTTHRIHPDMLRDVNRWIMESVNGDPESFLLPMKD